MNEKDITTMVNEFARMYGKYMDTEYSLEGLKAGLIEDEINNCWDLIACRPEKDDARFKIIFDLPDDIPSDKTDAMIYLAGFISQKLNNYFKYREIAENLPNNKLSAKERSDAARKAAKARWDKKKDSKDN